MHDDGTPASDLYLIDRLLHMMIDHQNGGWQELEHRYNATATAMQRLRLALESGEMERIGLGLADYFRSTPTTEAAAGYVCQPEAENAKLREALKQARLLAQRNGYTMREFAEYIGITTAQLSAWTDATPNREPDFKD